MLSSVFVVAVVVAVDCSIVVSVAVLSLSSAVMETVTMAIEAAVMAASELAASVAIALVLMVFCKRFRDSNVTYAVESHVQIHVAPTGYPCHHQQSIADLQHPTLLTLAMSTHGIAPNVDETMTLYHPNAPVPAATLNNPTK